jgi:hypothetical protein
MLAFVHIHKTGGTTVWYILRSSFGPRHCELEPWDRWPSHLSKWQVPISADDLRRVRKLYPRLESIGGHCIQPHMDLEQACPEIKYFTLLRDPIKMRASMFQHGVQKHGEGKLVFEEWLQGEKSRNRQTKMIAGVPDVNKAIQIIREKGIFVGLTDRFDESMLLLQSLVASNLDIKYRRMRVTTQVSVAQSLLSSPETRQMLAEGHEQDIELYNYIQQELYPAYRREYGEGLEQDLAQYQASLAEYSHSQVEFSQISAKPSVFKLPLLRDLAPFDRRNVLLSLLKKNLLYRPALFFNRMGVPIV